MGRIWGVALAVTLAVAGLARAEVPAGPLVPERRLVVSPDLDFYGADLRTILDTSFEGCRAACLADEACKALTYNARAGSCFPKSGVAETRPYAGALSGHVLVARVGNAAARARAGALAGLRAEDFAAALAQAVAIGTEAAPGARPVEDWLAEARRWQGVGNAPSAVQAQAAGVALGDLAADWAAYAGMLLALPGDEDALRAQAERALSAAINARLRAGDGPVAVEALMLTGRALVRLDRGREAIAVLRAAVAEAPGRGDLTALLDETVEKHGFRVTGHEVTADAARPTICADFSEELAGGATDYAPFLRSEVQGLAISASGSRLCVTGIEHGRDYRFTFRAGLPAASGEVTAKDVTLTAYVRDRSPQASFPGRAYVLPRAPGAGIPVVTVNAPKLDVALSKVADRNLVQALREDSFGRPLAEWQGRQLVEALAEPVWSGTLEPPAGGPDTVNREVTVRLPLDEPLKGQGPGIYLLSAAVPGLDPYDHPPALQWFVVSDIGLATVGGTDGLHVFARALGSARALAGVEVALVSRANAVLASAVTDAEGRADFGPGLTAGTGNAAPALVTARMGEDSTFLPLTDPEFDLSDRGVEGREAPGPIDVFLATDRGAYRPGEVIHATALARDPRAEALPGVPVTLRLMRPDGVEHLAQLAPEAGAGGHLLDMALPADAPRGTWVLEARTDPKAAPLAVARLLVEDFLPERIDFDLGLSEAPLALGASPEVAVDARYLYGAPGAGLRIEGDLRLAPATTLEAWPGYRFGRHDAEPQSWYESLAGDAETDAAGRATVRLVFPETGAIAGPLTARVAVRLSEGSARPVERRLTRAVLPDHPVIGVKPLFEGALDRGAEARFDVLALGPDAQPVALDVRWRLNRVETDWQWYVLYGEWQWEPVTTRTEIDAGVLTLDPAAPGRIALPTDWGEYELVVTGPGGATTSTGFPSGWYAAGAGTDTPDRLTVALDRAAYRPGDTALLRIEAATAGTALVNVVSDRLIDSRAVAVTAGAQEIALPVTDAWGAGAYVAATLVRPLDQTQAEQAPVRALGLAHAAVDPGAHRLTASLQAPAEADPRGPLEVALKVEGIAPGETATAVIAAVDEGILNLTGFKAPDPGAHYFGQRRLGVALRDLYGRLIDGQAGRPGMVRSGGDGAAAMGLQGPPPTEDLLAFVSGPVTVGPDGLARARFDLPAFNGSVRLMAIAWSQTGVGQAQAQVLVRDPVVVTASLPRFLAPGDAARLRLDIAHAKGPAGEMALEVTGQGVTLGAAPATVTLAEGGRQAVTVPLTAGPAAGDGEIRVALTPPGGARLEQVLRLPVRVLDPEVARQTRVSLAPGQGFTVTADAFAGLVPGTGRMTLAAGPVARFDAAGLLHRLDTYPYGCTEQVTSKALPLLYLSSVAGAMGAKGAGDLDARIAGAIGKVLLNQSAGGSFGLWRPDAGDLWLDAYVTDFLSRARATGHAVPETAFRAALDNLRSQLSYAPEFDADGGPWAYALMVLAREGAAAIGDVRYYADQKPAAFDTPIAAAQLGAALAMVGEQARADAMFARAVAMARGAAPEGQVWRADYGTPLRDAAAVLALATEAGSTAGADPGLATRVAQGLGDATAVSTQEAAWSLLATQALIAGSAAPRLTLAGAPVAGPFLRAYDDLPAPMTLTNAGDRPTDLTLTTFGTPAEPEPEGGRGWRIARSYYTLDGDPAEIGALKQGDRLVAVLDITPLEGGAARLMIDDPLPAGIEIDNPALIRGGDIAALDWLETAEPASAEFRAERFRAAVDAQDGAAFRLAYILRAVTPGRFHQPAASLEDMYRPEFRARTATGEVTIAE
ncbi:alpha-2-macroglobulin family protein [Frigidibacter sp. MR17.14]|uniref:alpha-2-macroglobulin family protein n=1 Tax=Frigidibacter sp. MR17.14 TaxID=3126509 RepID=UPI003012E291